MSLEDELDEMIADGWTFEEIADWAMDNDENMLAVYDYLELQGVN